MCSLYDSPEWRIESGREVWKAVEEVAALNRRGEGAREAVAGLPGKDLVCKWKMAHCTNLKWHILGRDGSKKNVFLYLSWRRQFLQLKCGKCEIWLKSAMNLSRMHFCVSSVLSTRLLFGVRNRIQSSLLLSGTDHSWVVLSRAAEVAFRQRQFSWSSTKQLCTAATITNLDGKNPSI
jgi:hypothetical protein